MILGNERDGVSDEAKCLADGGVYISMNGFTESLNVSVASSMIMHHAVQDRTRRLGCTGTSARGEEPTGGVPGELVPRYRSTGTSDSFSSARAGRRNRAREEEEDEEVEEDAEDEERCEETDDEVFLLNALRSPRL